MSGVRENPLKEKREKERRRLQQILRTPDGMELLKILRAQYYDDYLEGADSHQTYRLLGRRDVVLDLLRLTQGE